MHYLLVRNKDFLAAIITGVIAQLILLSTTYIQMVANDEFIFFFIIFLQSLVLLVYGLVVRAKSFVIPPLVFVILSVITVAFSVLSGLSTIIMIGCTGVVLLALGIIALLMRERITKATVELGSKLGGWQGYSTNLNNLFHWLHFGALKILPHPQTNPAITHNLTW